MYASMACCPTLLDRDKGRSKVEQVVYPSEGEGDFSFPLLVGIVEQTT